jgi:hypothetical protein
MRSKVGAEQWHAYGKRKSAHNIFAERKGVISNDNEIINVFIVTNYDNESPEIPCMLIIFV